MVFDKPATRRCTAFTLILCPEAARDLTKIRHAKEIATVVETMAILPIDPYMGSIVEGEKDHERRKHAGAYRLKYLVDKERKTVIITQIPRRPKA